jgi:hypothetical protein
MERSGTEVLERHVYRVPGEDGREGQIELVQGGENYLQPYGVTISHGIRSPFSSFGRGFDTREEAESFFISVVTEQKETGEDPPGELLATGLIGVSGRHIVDERLLLEVDIERDDVLAPGRLRLIRRVEPIGSNGEPKYTVEWWSAVDVDTRSTEEFKTLTEAWERFGKYVQAEEMWAFANDFAEAQLPGHHEQVEKEREARWAELSEGEEENPF